MASRYADPRAAEYIAARNRGPAADLDADYEALSAQLRRRGIDGEAIATRRGPLCGRPAFLGRGHRRHALRPLPRSRRAAQRL